MIDIFNPLLRLASSQQRHLGGKSQINSRQSIDFQLNIGHKIESRNKVQSILPVNILYF